YRCHHLQPVPLLLAHLDPVLVHPLPLAPKKRTFLLGLDRTLLLGHDIATGQGVATGRGLWLVGSRFALTLAVLKQQQEHGRAELDIGIVQEAEVKLVGIAGQDEVGSPQNVQPALTLSRG
ncbi:MAG: hypothetical protein NTY65_00480, partial [Planctomycetota bacterium]|nr:hypothetical protein [Planctomycetota bacterium]